MTEQDTDLIVAWRNKEFVRENFIYRGPFTRQVHENWIETKIKTGKVVQFMICLEGDRAIGSVYLNDIDETHHHAEYGIFIGEDDCLGKGYGTQAAELAIWYAFHELHLHKLFLRLLDGNERAKRSYEKVGFTCEGHFKDYVYVDGSYRDVVFMSILNPEDRDDHR